MTFREQVAADIPAVFLNPAEFGVSRSIDGSPVVCVLDDEARSMHTAEGVFISTSILHVKASDLAAPPVIGQRMVIDDRPANVAHIAEAMGVLSIRLQWFES